MKTIISMVIIILIQNINLQAQNVYLFELTLNMGIENVNFLDDVCKELKSRKLQFYESDFLLNIICDSNSVLYEDLVLEKNNPSKREGTFLKDNDIILDFAISESEDRFYYNCDIYIIKIINNQYYLTVGYYNNQSFSGAILYEDNFNRKKYFEDYNKIVISCVDQISDNLNELIENCCNKP